MFRFPSHKNSNNERTARRRNAKADVVKTAQPTKEQEMERMQNTAAALIADNKISVVNYGHCTGYRIQLSPMNWREVINNGGFACACADHLKFDTCAHIMAAETFAAAQESEKQAKIAATRELLADLETEQPSKGFVNISRAKVLAAVERVKNQDFTCQVRKTETGKYEVYSFNSTNTYKVELNRGIFGVTGWCECFDFTFARLAKNEVCKHLAGVYFFERRETVVSLNEANAENYRRAA